MSTETFDHLTRALQELRLAASSYAEAGMGCTGSADALYDLVRTTEGVLYRIEPDVVIGAGDTSMVQAQSLVIGDRLIGPGGVVTQQVTAIARFPYRIDVQVSGDTWAATWTSYDRTDLVEVAA